jgi:hypothetical protein
LFGYAPGRGAKQAETLFAGIKPGGVLMSDGYEVYGGIAQIHGLTHLGCWAHARRYLVEAEAVIPKASRGPEQIPTQFIAAIGALYAVESEARERKLDAEARRHLRAEKSSPVLARIETMLLAHLHAVVPNSLLGKALHYLSTQWPKLTRYVENGAWPIDNNLAENAIRPFVVGRRNWLFADTVAGAMPAPTSIRWSRRARPMASIPTPIWSASSANSPPLKPPTTSKPSCLGVWQAVADRLRFYSIASAIVNGGVNRALTTSLNRRR